MQIYDDESFVNRKAANGMIPFIFFIQDFPGNPQTSHRPENRSGQ